MLDLLDDLRHGLRSLLRAPGVLVGGVFCLALGLGANSALLGVLDLLLLRPPEHVRQAESLRRIYFREHSGQEPQDVASYPMYADLAGKIGGASAVGAYAPFKSSLGRGEAARRVRVVVATANLLPLLGVEPALGRSFSGEEGDPERPAPVALIGWELWHRAFDGAPAVLGQSLAIGPGAYTVIGVLPRGFTGIDLEPIDAWLPLGAAGPLLGQPSWTEDRGTYFLSLVARLRPGAAPERVAEEATARNRQAYEALGYRGVAERRVTLEPIQVGRSAWGAPAGRLAAWLAGASGAVLAIACLNVAGLLIVRGLERRRELAVRLALGAGRSRLTRLLLAEALVLALLGGVAAAALIPVAGSLVRAYLLPEGAPPATLLDPRLLATLLGLTFGAGLLSGLAPALRGSRLDLGQAIKTGGGTGSPRGSRLRGALLAGQVALTILLLVGAGLFLASLRNVGRLDLGLDVERVLVATVDFAAAGYRPAEVEAFFGRAVERVRRLPEAERASVAAGIPFRSSFGTSVTVSGRADVPGLAPGGIYYNAVGDEYLETLGIELVRGRALTAADGAERVAVVNHTMARLLWPGQDALGQCFEVAEGPCTTVVGIAADSRRSALVEPPTMQFYVPLRQAPEWMAERALFVRAAADPQGLAGAVRRELQAAAPGLPFVDVRPLSELVASRTRPWRTGAALLIPFSLLALTLAAVGIFASVARSATTRRREMAIRMALGARPGELVWQLTWPGLGLAALGAAVGLALAALGGRYVEPLLFDVSAADPLVISAALLSVLAAALVASSVPGLRIGRIDPAAEMRSQ